MAEQVRGALAPTPMATVTVKVYLLLVLKGYGGPYTVGATHFLKSVAP